MIDYYNLLGVPPDATAEQIRRAFRQQAKRAHPDAHPGSTPEKREAQKRRFIQLAQAYDTLADPAERARYHRKWSAAGGAERKRSSRASARDKAGPFRSAQAEFGAARRASPAGGTGAQEGDTLDDLLQDAEQLLGGFGLSLRHPFSELLDALLDWAREVFAQVMEPSQDEQPAGRRRPEGGREQESRAARDPKSAPENAKPGRMKNRAGRKKQGASSEAELDAELRKLKEKMGRR